MFKRYQNRPACLGFSLLELLVSLSIMSIGLLGFAHQQQTTWSVEREQIRLLQAHLLLDEIVSVLQATQHPERYVSSGGHHPAITNCIETTCDPRTFSHFQLALWKCRSGSMPQRQCATLDIAPSVFAHGQLAIRPVANRFVIELKWHNANGEKQTLARSSPISSKLK